MKIIQYLSTFDFRNPLSKSFRFSCFCFAFCYDRPVRVCLLRSQNLLSNSVFLIIIEERKELNFEWTYTH